MKKLSLVDEFLRKPGDGLVVEWLPFSRNALTRWRHVGKNWVVEDRADARDSIAMAMQLEFPVLEIYP